MLLNLHNMKGKYQTKDGIVEVLEFDEVNKIVRTDAGWVGEPAYKDWESLEVPAAEEVAEAEQPTETVEEVVEELIVGEVIEEEPEVPKEKKKRTYKKKKP